MSVRASLLMTYEARSNDVVSNLANLDDIAQHLTAMIPMQVLADIDNSRNPMLLTKERLERAATENQFMNGKIAAINVGFVVLLQLIPSDANCPVIPSIP